MKEPTRDKENKNRSVIHDVTRSLDTEPSGKPEDPFPSNPFEQAFNMASEEQKEGDDQSNVTMHPAFLPRMVKETNDEAVIPGDSNGQRRINLIDKEDSGSDIPVINRLDKEVENAALFHDGEKNEDTFKKVIKIPETTDLADKKEISHVKKSAKKDANFSPPPLFEPILPESEDITGTGQVKDSEDITGTGSLKESAEIAGPDPLQRSDKFQGSFPERSGSSVSFFETDQKNTGPFIPSKESPHLQAFENPEQNPEEITQNIHSDIEGSETELFREKERYEQQSQTRNNGQEDIKTSAPKYQGILGSIFGGFKKLLSRKNLIDRMEEVQRDIPGTSPFDNKPESLPRDSEKGKNVITEKIKSPHDRVGEETETKKDKDIFDTNGLGTISNPDEEIQPAEIDETAFRKITPIQPNITPESGPENLSQVDMPIDTTVTENTAAPSSASNSVPQKSSSDPVRADILQNTDKSADKSELNNLKEEVKNTLKDNDRLSGNIKDINERMNYVDNYIQTLESSHSLIQSDLDSNGRKINVLENKLTTIEEVVEQFHLDNVDVKDQLGLISDNITRLSDQYSMIFEHIQKMTTFSNEMSEDIFNTGQRIDLLEQGLKKMGEKQVQLKQLSSQRKTSVDERFNELESRNEEIKKSSLEDRANISKELEQLTDFVEKELKNLGGRSYRTLGESVHLSEIIKNSTNMKLCMEWLEFLMELVGSNNLDDILSYYEELGWISTDVRIELMRYSEGIDHYIEKSDWKLTPDDHVKSIWFIERLAGIKVDKNTLSMMEKDIKKMKKGSEIYGI